MPTLGRVTFIPAVALCRRVPTLGHVTFIPAVSLCRRVPTLGRITLIPAVALCRRGAALTGLCAVLHHVRENFLLQNFFVDEIRVHEFLWPLDM